MVGEVILQLVAELYIVQLFVVAPIADAPFLLNVIVTVFLKMA